jgi:hypothetical protein
MLFQCPAGNASLRETPQAFMPRRSRTARGSAECPARKSTGKFNKAFYLKKESIIHFAMVTAYGEPFNLNK